MKKIIIIFLLSQISLQDSFVQEDGVNVLSSSKLDSFINHYQYAVVFTYMPSCQYCQNVLKFLGSLSARLKSLNVETGKYNVNMYKDYKEHINVSKFPNIRLYINGFYLNYPFENEEDKIFNWVKTMINRKPIVRHLKQNSDYKIYKKHRIAYVMKYPLEDKSLEIIPQTLSIIYKIPIFVVEKEFEFYDSDKYYFYMWRTFDDGPKSLSDNQNFFDKRILQEFISMFDSPNVNVLDQKQTSIVLKDKIKTVFVFDTSYETQTMTMIHNLSFKYKEQIHFVKSKLTEINSDQFAHLLDISIDDLPQIRILGHGKENFLKYKPKGATEEEIDEFIQQGIDDKLKPFYKSEPLPKTSPRFIKKLVRENFNRIVMDDTKDVLVAFTTAWCEHCQEINTAFNLIKDKLKKDVRDLVFAKIDYDKNDLDVEIREFPTIYLYKKDDKENPVDYLGMRDWEVILDFLQDQLNKSLYTKSMPQQLADSMPDVENNENLKTVELQIN